jgi:hypothetical protein
MSHETSLIATLALSLIAALIGAWLVWLKVRQLLGKTVPLCAPLKRCPLSRQ